MKSQQKKLLGSLVLLALLCPAAFPQNLFVSDGASGNIYEYTPGGMRTTFASGLNSPQGIAFDSAGNLYVAELSSGNIYEYTPAGARTTFGHVPNSPNGLAFDSAGNLYVANNGGSSIIKFFPDGTTNVFASSLNGVTGLAFDQNGNLFAAEAVSHLVDEFKTNGTKIVSSTLPLNGNNIPYPAGLATDSFGNLFVAASYGDQMTNFGGVYELTNALTPGEIPVTPIAPNSGLLAPVGLAIDTAGNLYVADSANGNTNIGAVYKYALGGSMTTFASEISPSYIAFGPTVIPFTYTTNNGTITITGYTGSGGAVTIPAIINGYPVTSIGEGAFAASSLTSVMIPESVTSIGVQSFANCDSLTSVTIPNSVTTIGELAFGYCSSLTSETIPGGLTSIGLFAFVGCTSLTNITVATSNPSYTSLNGVLFDKTQLTLIQFPAGLGGTYTIPNSVTAIGMAAFDLCAGLTNVTIGNSVTNIGSVAFDPCTGLDAVYFLGNAPTPTNDNSVFESDGSAIAYYLPGTTGWSSTFDGIPAVLLAPPPPALGISAYGSQPAVFFPTATGTNYVLQMTTNLASGNWVTITNGLPISGLVITNPPPNAFFRLH